MIYIIEIHCGQNVEFGILKLGYVQYLPGSKRLISKLRFDSEMLRHSEAPSISRRSE